MYKISVFIHIISAMFWLGGMIFTVLVLVPVSRHRLFEHKRGKLFEIAGRQFSKLSWIAFGILIITGITNLLSRGYSWGELAGIQFWQTEFGQTLFYKLVFFVLILVLSAIHDFYAGPKAAKLMDQSPDTPETQRIRKASSWLGRINLLLGLIVIYFALSMLRG